MEPTESVTVSVRMLRGPGPLPGPPEGLAPGRVVVHELDIAALAVAEAGIGIRVVGSREEEG